MIIQSVKDITQSRLRRSVVALAVCWVVLLVVFGIGTARVTNYASKAEKQIYNITQLSGAAAGMLKGSNILTEQCRLFVITGNRNYMDAYFTEAKEDRNRDKAFDIVHSQNDPVLDAMFLEGLNASRELMRTEYHAMALAASAYGIMSLPREIAEYPLTVTEHGMSPNDKLKAAMDMLFNTAYTDAKQTINSSASRFAETAATSSESSVWYQIHYLNRNIMLMRIGLGASVAVFLGFMSVFLITERFRENQAKRIREMTKKSQEQEKSIISDHLTGLPNRLGLSEFIGPRLADLSRYPELYAGYSDIDYFKSINDTYGHLEGDSVLCRVAEAFRQVCEEFDGFCARVGGDEFVFIFNAVDAAEAELFRYRVKEAVSRTNEGRKIKVSISMGCAPCDTDDLNVILAKADEKLYEDKKSKHLR